MKLNLERKLELERIYKNYCNNNLEGIRGEDEFVDMLFKFVEFRLNVSGGSCSNCRVSMESVSNFLNEVFLYENMMDDWGGCYRGDVCYEMFEELEILVNESNLKDDEKKEILEGYKKYYEMEEDDEE
jgi:hypothetical protein